jgi:probable addiction module antidote protein
MPRLAVKTEPYRESLLESLKNPEEAAQYLNACLEDDDARVFLLALRDVAEARGGIRALSHTAHLNRESLYRMLSKSGNPSLNSLWRVFRVARRSSIIWRSSSNTSSPSSNSPRSA